MRTKQLLIAAAFVATAVSSTFGKWYSNENIKILDCSNSSGDIYFSIDYENEYYKDGWKDKLFIIRKEDGVSDVAMQKQLDILLTAVSAGKKIRFSVNDTRVDYHNNPGYKVNTVGFDN